MPTYAKKQKPKVPPPDAAPMVASVPVRQDGSVPYVDLREIRRARLVLADGGYIDVQISRHDPRRIVVRGSPGPIVVCPEVSNMVEIAEAPR